MFKESFGGRLAIFIVLSVLLSITAVWADIDNIQVSNLTNSAVTITWTTDDSTDGCVHYGLDTTVADTVCDSRSDDDIHYVNLTGLATDTTYYFEVYSDSVV